MKNNTLRGVPVEIRDINNSIIITLNPIHGEYTKEAELVLECACFSKINSRKNYPIEKAAGFLTGCSENAYEGTYDAFEKLLPFYKDFPVENLQEVIDNRKRIIERVCS